MLDYIMNTARTTLRELKFFKVDPSNLHQALDIQRAIWPDNPVDFDYTDKINSPRDFTNASWLVYHGNNLIGLTGVYAFDPSEPGYDHDESIWMDWFGVLPQYRGRRYGKDILCSTIEYAQGLGRFKYFRLDTTDFPGRVSTHLYDQVMQLREDYTAEPMPADHRGLVYSYSLDGSPIKPWNNQLLNLGYYGAAEVTVN